MVCAIRLYKDRYNKISKIKLLNTAASETKILKAKDVKLILQNYPNSICNLKLSKSGELIMSDMLNGRHATQYHITSLGDNGSIHHLCFVTSFEKGLISFVADTIDIRDSKDYIEGDRNTFEEIASILEIELPQLRFVNAYIDHEKFMLYIKGSYRSLGEIGEHRKNAYEQIDPSWDFTIDTSESEKISLLTLGNAAGAKIARTPENVNNIHKFLGGVTNLILSETLENIGESCFEQVDDLLTVVMNDKISVIPERCFAYSALRNIQFSEKTLRKIDDEAFYTCQDLKGTNGELKINALELGKRSFSDTKLQRVRLLSTVLIDNEAFAYNSELLTINLPMELRQINGGAFKNCTKLRRVYTGTKLKYIGKRAFQGCKHLKEIKIPKECKYFEDSFPKGCNIITF